jgi:hypothetical protein
MEQVALLSVATASIAFSVAETKLFAPLRDGLARRSRFWSELVSCGYCLGHWLAFALVAIYRPRLFAGGWLVDYFLTALVIAWLAAFQWAALSWLTEKAGK